MAARRGPTYLRVILGKELRTLRERTGETAESVSEALGFSRTKLSRVEKGDIPLPKLADLERLMDRYKITDPDDRETLLAMQRGSLSTEPWTSYRHILPSGGPLFFGLERDAKRICGYENTVVAGLLQAESYARAQLSSAKIVEERTTEFVEHGVRMRMERKKKIEAPNGVELHIILTENTLRTVIGSPEVMRAQYEEIIRLNELENVEVQIIPENLPTYRAAWSFTMLEFDALDPVIASDSYKATTMWSKETDVWQYQRHFSAMAKAAPGPLETPRILNDLERKLWR
ncbi:helix-turn-helix transcriptional regulator [Streptomyces sp. NPDC045456]|uniref:helix-turn-helix domain-containing protein n=1 Tax=Streptomyces sp. NPDC045456 TaxID=3155254 RepID=UPI0033F6A384